MVLSFFVLLRLLSSYRRRSSGSVILICLLDVIHFARAICGRRFEQSLSIVSSCLDRLLVPCTVRDELVECLFDLVRLREIIIIRICRIYRLGRLSSDQWRSVSRRPVITRQRESQSICSTDVVVMDSRMCFLTRNFP